MGFCVFLTFALKHLQRHLPNYKKWLYASFIIILLVFSHKTYQRNFDWKNDYELFESALKVNKLNAKLWNNVGHALEGKGHFAEALTYFQNAARVQPDDVGAHINVGRTYKNLNNTRDAEINYQKALDLIPKPVKGKSYTTRIAPDYLKAFTSLASMISKDPDRLHEAEGLLRRVMSMRTDFIQAYQHMGDVLVKMKRFPEALDNYIKAISYDPEDADLYFNLAVVYLNMNRKTEAFTNLNIALSKNPDHESAMHNKASILQESKHAADKLEAKQLYNTLLKLNKKGAHTHSSLAMIETDQKNYEIAKEHYLKAIEIDPYLEMAHFNLALLFSAELKDFDKSYEYTMKLLNINPSHFKAHMLVGDILINHFNEPRKALQHFETAYTLSPTNVQAKHNMCVCYYSLNRMIDAEKCFSEAVDMAPGEKYISDGLSIIRERLKINRL